MQYSDASAKRGIIQKIERELGWDDGTISGNSALLAAFTADINDALDYIFGVIFRIAGWSWQADDINQTDYPIGTINLVSGQRDYAFTADADGNLILEIFRVAVANPSGVFSVIKKIDVESDDNAATFIDGQNASGQPYRYDLTANGIFLDPIPNYSLANGLKLYFSRESTYFTTSDTTKKPGFVGLYHDWLALRPAANYAANKTFKNAASLENRANIREGQIMDYYGRRMKDGQPNMKARRSSNK